MEEDRGGSLVRVASDVTFHARIRNTCLPCCPVSPRTKRYVRAGRDLGHSEHLRTLIFPARPNLVYLCTFLVSDTYQAGGRTLEISKVRAESIRVLEPLLPPISRPVNLTFQGPYSRLSVSEPKAQRYATFSGSMSCNMKLNTLALSRSRSRVLQKKGWHEAIHSDSVSLEYENAVDMSVVIGNTAAIHSTMYIAQHLRT